jgi:hypothetical protein
MGGPADYDELSVGLLDGFGVSVWKEYMKGVRTGGAPFTPIIRILDVIRRSFAGANPSPVAGLFNSQIVP